MSDAELPLSVRIKCRVYGHDWIYFRDRGERRCHRCRHEEAYSVDETHADDGAEKGATRYRIENNSLYIEVYQVTAWGEDSEYWQWFPTGRGPATEEDLEQLRRELERHLDTDDDQVNDL